MIRNTGVWIVAWVQGKNFRHKNTSKKWELGDNYRKLC